MRDRGLLHFNQLEAFTAWAADKGWVQEPTKDFYEVLRLRKGKDVAIFHKRDRAKEHVTTYGKGEGLARSYVQWRKNQRAAAEGESVERHA